MSQLVRVDLILYATRQAAALALAGLVAAGLWTFGGPSDAARPGNVPPTGEIIHGQARAIDGDTLDVGGVRVRLEGIDAPEMAQTCNRKWWGTWACGQYAAEILQRLIADRDVECRSRGRDTYGRMLGECSTAGLAINAYMVRNGLAWAFVRYSGAYVEAEAEARTLRLGIWQAETPPAWEYRSQRWSATSGSAPKGCAIKGNITRSGQLYHMPWSPFYTRIKIDQQRGERWFCSEAEAIAAGWHPAAYR